MSIAYLDTHAAIFLHDGLLEEFSGEAKRQIESSDLLISPVVLLEFSYLFKRKKINAEANALLASLGAMFGVGLCSVPFASVTHEALNIDWTEDPFDRLIVAQAQANQQAKLITRDRLIRRNYANVVW
ncbi:MAG TPA: PIN domain-containing protein [Bryobacteraceae bacterium]